MNRLAKRLLAAAGILAAFYLFLWLGLPPIVRSLAQSKMSEALGRKTTIADVALNPFTLELTVTGLSVEEPGGGAVFAKFDRLYANLEISSLFRRAAVVKAVTLDGPALSIVRNEDSSYNFSDLLKAKEGEPKKEEKESEPTRFFLGNIAVNGGAVTVDNRPAKTAHKVTEIGLFLPSLSNLPVYVEEFAKPRLSFTFDGSKIELEGRTKPFADSLETEFDVKVASLDLLKYLPYSPVEFGFEVKSAKLDVDLLVNYVQRREGASSLVASGGASLSGVELADRAGGELLGFAKAQVALAPSDLLAGRVEVASFTVDGPHAKAVREADGTLNLAVLGKFAPKGEVAAEKPAEPEKPVGEAKPFDLTVRKVRVGPGRVAFEDRAAPFALSVSDLTVEAGEISLKDSTLGQASVTLACDGGEKLAATASGSWKPEELKGSARLENLSIPRFKPYYAAKLPVEVQGGRVAKVGCDWEWKGGSDALLSQAFLLVENLAVAKKGSAAPFFTQKALSVEGASANVKGREANMGSVALVSPKVAAVRDEAGKIDLAELGAKEASEPAPPPGAQSAEPGWTWSVGALDLTGGEAEVADRAVAPAATHRLTALTVRARGFTNRPNAPGKAGVSATLNGSGALKAEIGATVDPPSADASFSLSGLDLTAVNPYLAKELKLALASGALGVKGRAAWAAKPTAGPAWTFAGDADLRGFRAVEETSAEDLVRFGSLGLSGVTASGDPLKISVGAVNLSDPYARVDLSPEGALNFAGLRKNAPVEGEKPAEPVKREGEGVTVEVGGLAVSGGAIDFSDRHIKPGYRMTLSNLSGRVSAMSSLATEGGEASLIGSIDGYAPLELSGRVNPFAKDLFVDVKVDFRNIDMSPFTPYSSRYLGYAIAKGKLGLALQYKIVGRKLDSGNKVVIDQLTLGERTPNPDELSIPVRFALALLTDRKGVIDLDVPVSGTLDDPEFSWGRIVWKVIVNVLVKAVTSPFALIGSLFGDGADLSSAAFDPGRDALTPEAKATLDKLGKALAERPALKLDLTGRADPVRDRDALRAAAFVKKLKAAKLKKLLAAPKEPQPAPPGAAQAAPIAVPSPPPELDAVEFTGEERAGLVAAAYEEEGLPKPAPNARPPTPEEMENLLVTSVSITPDDLRGLAGRRAKAALDYLVAEQKVDPARLFIVEAGAGEGEKPENAGSKVEFTLK